MSQPAPPHEYPNVKARLRLSLANPLLPSREAYMDIWMRGTRFRVRDESGRHVGAILGDLSASRGLGVPARSMEEIMDAWSQSRDMDAPALGATELYGDLATGEGWVLSRGQPARHIEAEELAPAAEQILTATYDEQLEPRGQTTLLGRPATEYHGFLEGEDQGIPYRNEVTRLVSPPYLLLSKVLNAQNPNHALTREVVSIEEGSVADSDVMPP